MTIVAPVCRVPEAAPRFPHVNANVAASGRLHAIRIRPSRRRQCPEAASRNCRSASRPSSQLPFPCADTPHPRTLGPTNEPAPVHTGTPHVRQKIPDEHHKRQLPQTAHTPSSMGYTAASVLVHTRAHPSDAFTVCPPGIPGLSRTDSSFAALLWLLVGSPP